MLIVAPNGRTKLEVLFETLLFSSTHSMVIGSVAELLAVLMAVSKARSMLNV